MLKVYKLPCPSRFSSSEVLYNCLAAGEPYIAYALTHLFCRLSPPSRGERCWRFQRPLNRWTRDTKLSHSVWNRRILPSLKQSVIEVVGNLSSGDTTSSGTLDVRFFQRCTPSLGVLTFWVCFQPSLTLPCATKHPALEPRTCTLPAWTCSPPRCDPQQGGPHDPSPPDQNLFGMFEDFPIYSSGTKPGTLQSGFDDGIARNCTRTINRLRSILPQIYPSLEKVFAGSTLTLTPILDLLISYKRPQGLKQAGYRRVLN